MVVKRIVIRFLILRKIRRKRCCRDVKTTLSNMGGCLTADPGVSSLIPARSHALVDIDHEKNCMAILLPSAESSRVVVSYKRNYMQEIKLTRKKCG